MLFSSFGLCGWAEGVPSMIDIPGNPFNSYGAVVAFGDSNKANLRYGIYQIAPNTLLLNIMVWIFGSIKEMELLILRNCVSQSLQMHKFLFNSISKTRALKVSSRDQANAIYQSNLPAGTMTLGGWLGSGSYQAVADLESPNLKIMVPMEFLA